MINAARDRFLIFFFLGRFRILSPRRQQCYDRDNTSYTDDLRRREMLPSEFLARDIRSDLLHALSHLRGRM